MAKFKYRIKLELEAEFEAPLLGADTTHFKRMMCDIIAKESLEEMLEEKHLYVTLKKEINQDNLHGSISGEKDMHLIKNDENN